MSGTASAGTNSDPTTTYDYGAYLYYNLGYGGFANILAGTWNWKYQPVFLYNPPGMRYIIYEKDDVESESVHSLKRSFKGPTTVENSPDNGTAHAHPADASLEPYVSPSQQSRHHRHLSQHRQHMSDHTHRDFLSENSPNSSMAQDPGSIIYKRSDPDTPMLDADARRKFSLANKFDSPSEGPKEVRLPEFRCKYQMSFCDVRVRHP